jgi:phosphoribosylcarboxyaminoimidazole (NCAIR) mutase
VEFRLLPVLEEQLISWYGSINVTTSCIGVPVNQVTRSMAGTVFYQSYKCLEVPVATVALNGSKNAGILAAQIIGSHDKAY